MENLFKGTIYQAVNIQNNKSYIGKTTVEFLKYKEGHIKNALNNSEVTTKYFYNAIKKYGNDNFKWIVLGEVFADSKKELTQKLNEAEIESIWLFRTFGESGELFDEIYGYNMTKGGDGGNCTSAFSEERKKEYSIKLSESRTGSKRSEETKKRQSDALLGHEVTEETRQKLSIANTGVTLIDRHGEEKAQEIKNKISEKGKLWKRSPHKLEDRLKQSASMKNKPIVICPFCNKSGKGDNMNRYHLDNCKLNPINKDRDFKTERATKRKGIKHTDETRIKMSIAWDKKPMLACPYCGKEGKNGGMYRYHFENCKFKDTKI